MVHIFICGEGDFMRNYIITDDVLCFTSNGYGTYVMEKNKDFYLSIDCLKLLKYGCNFYGNSYNIQRQFVIDIFNYYIKTPIIVSDYNMIIFFPTAAPNSKECIWISYNNIDRYVKEKDYTKIFFKGGKVINISTSFSTIDSQITKCIKIEKYLTTKRYANC